MFQSLGGLPFFWCALGSDLIYYISVYMCISRFVRLLLGSERPSATGSLAVHQGLYGASFRLWLLVYLRVHLIAACGGQPKAAVQHIPVCSLLPSAHCGRPTAPFQHMQVYFSFLLLCMAGGRRPLFSTLAFVARFFAVYGRQLGAAFHYIQVCVYFRYRRMAGSGQLEVAFQYIQVYI